MNIHVYHHVDHEATLDTISAQLRALLAQGTTLMSKLEELEAELQAANVVTNEIAADLDDLIAKLSAPGLTEAEADLVKADIQALTGKLAAVAAKHTP